MTAVHFILCEWWNRDIVVALVNPRCVQAPIYVEEAQSSSVEKNASKFQDHGLFTQQINLDFMCRFISFIICVVGEMVKIENRLFLTFVLCFSRINSSIHVYKERERGGV